MPSLAARIGTFTLALLLAACQPTPPSAPAAAPSATVESPQTAADVVSRVYATPPKPTLPATVDLRPRLTSMGLPPRPQGARGTCSIFTTCEAIEFANAQRTGKPVRLSPEFVNWAASQAAGRPSDGNFFHNALAGFEKYGVCAEPQMPYHKAYDTKRAPSAQATSEAATIRDESRTTLAVRWIVPWQPNRFGVSDDQLTEIRRVIASGYPVAAGSGHSRLLVGYVDDDKQPGGGTFYTEDSALNRFDQVTYEFVRKDVADVFWIEALAPYLTAPSKQ